MSTFISFPMHLVCHARKCLVPVFREFCALMLVASNLFLYMGLKAQPSYTLVQMIDFAKSKQ